MIIAKKKIIIIKHFNKDLVKFTEDGRSFKSNKKCWICNKLFVVGDNKARDYDHVRVKYVVSRHWS